MDKPRTKILITGGAGFIGSHLVDELLERGYQVLAIDNLVNGKLENLQEASAHNSFHFKKGDILDLEFLKDTLEGVDIIFHLACLGVRHSINNPIENHKVNAEGTLNVLEAARKHGIKKFFYISSSEVYGEAKSFPLDENTLTYPTTVYGASKLVGEHYTMSYRHYGLDVTVTRIFNNYGPRAHHEGDAGEIIPRSIVYMLNGMQPVIFGDGDITRDFFYVKDTARALADLIPMGNLQNELINIGTGQEITMKRLLKEVISAFGDESLSIKHLPARPADVPRLWVDARKFQNLTEFIPKYSFEQGMAETIAYFKHLNGQRNLLEEVKIINW